MSGRSGGNRRGKESKSSSNQASSGKMGGQSHGNVQKQGGSAVAKDSVNEKQNTEFTSKVQPTPEQIRLATMIQDSSRAAQSDEETASKIKELVELTKCDCDKAALVLHDCDYDLMRAVDVILEGGSPVDQWTESVSRKKKKQQSQPAKGEDGTNPDESWDGVIGADDKKDRSRRGRGGTAGQAGSGRGGVTAGERRSAPGDRRSDRGPPRMRNRGRGGTGAPREGENRGGRDSDGADDGRPRRAMNGAGGPGRGRGRGGGRGPRTFRNQQGPDDDNFPQSIDTWTNSQAEGYNESNKRSDLKVGKWDDFPNTDDWDNEEWTGSLADTRVFTPSSAPVAPNAGAAPRPEEERYEELPKPIGSGVVSPGNLPANGENVPSSPAVSTEQPITPNVSKGMAGPPGLHYSPHQGSTTLDLAALLGAKQPQQQQQQQTTEMDDRRYINPLKPVGRPNEMSPPPSNEVNLFPQMAGNEYKAQQASNVPVQRSRLKPRPSKIPSSAVEMPHDPIAVLDVQFGGLPFSEISSPPGSGPTAASDPSIVSFSVATSSSAGGYSSTKDIPPVATTAADRKPAASPGAGYYSRTTHSGTPPVSQGTVPQHPPPQSTGGQMESESVGQVSANGPYSTAQSNQGYPGTPSAAMYGTNKSSVSVSTGTETAVTVGGIYASAYQPNVSVNGTGNVQAVKMPQAPATTKEMPPASVQYRQATAPAKDVVGVPGGKPIHMQGYATQVNPGAATLPPILSYTYPVSHVTAPPPTAQAHYYPQQVQQVFPVDELSMLTQRMPPMQNAAAAGSSSASSTSRDSSNSGLGQGHHYSASSVSEKYGQNSSVPTSASQSMSNVGQSAQQRGDTAVSSPAPVAAQAVAPSTIPVSQPANAAHFATMTPLFMTYGQHYPQGIVPTTFHGAAFQTQLYPVAQTANNVHGHGSSNSSQYQKTNAFVQHPYSAAYDHLGSTDYSKTYMSNSKTAGGSGMGGGAGTMQGSDVMYANKKVAVSRPYDQFNKSAPPMAAAAPSAHFGQFHPTVMISGLPPTANAAGQTQHPSQMIPVQSYMQDGSGANARNQAALSQQAKVAAKAPGYNWGYN